MPSEQNKSGFWHYSIPLIQTLTVVGLVLSLIPTFDVLKRAFRTALWKPVPCVIVESKLTKWFPFNCATGGGIDLTKIEFQYVVAKQARRASLIHALGSYSRTNVIARFPAGKRATCYVNRANPAQAVLMRFPPTEDI